MTINGIQIDGQGTFNDVTENAGVVTTAVFAGSASNSGTVSVSAEFGGDSANHGEVTQVAVFAGNAVNTGTVAVAEFYDTAMNAGTVSTSAVFVGTSVNTGTVATAVFSGASVNDGGIVTGNAVFADTSVNSGTVQGDAQVAATATNSGTVAGNVTQYVPPNSNPSAGTVLQAGVTSYITISGQQIANGTHDVIADGNGGSYDGNYQYPANGTLLTIIDTYDYIADGSGGFTQYRPDYIWDCEFGVTCSNRGTGPHNNLGTMEPTLAVGVQMYDPSPWHLATGSGAFHYNDHYYYVVNGVITAIESCTGY